MEKAGPSTRNPERQLPNKRKRNKNDSCVDPLDYMLLPTPPPMDEEGIWRLERKYSRGRGRGSYKAFMIWKNVTDNQAIIPDVITDPAAREKEQLREELITNPFEEEEQRKEREKESWNLEEEKQLCSALKRKKQDFFKAAESVPNKTREECVVHWYHYKKKEDHIKACNTCAVRVERKRKRKLIEEQEDAAEAASPPKKSRSGRTIKVPRRFSKGAEGRQM
ncbi:unnamed protein product [Pocillopora meandrina]|uniref:SANT domain-containing protein n=1 Tax=Pocillopora meandrina TaxID=46732 RepID=A0AAU9X220_9CNID|nr:unnamed protein product [Pocillopora meandrina]